MAIFTAIGTAVGASAAAAAATGAAIVGTAVAVGGTVVSMQSAQASARAQRQAAQRQIRMQQAEAARQRRGAIRQSILARAQARTVAATTGQVAGTGFLGGMASLTSQLGANLGYGTMMSGLGQEYTALSGQAAYLASRSQMAEAIAGLGFGMVGRSGQIGQFVSGLTPAPTPQQTAYPQGQQF
jgi:hypothetical protein